MPKEKKTQNVSTSLTNMYDFIPIYYLQISQIFLHNLKYKENSDRIQC